MQETLTLNPHDVADCPASPGEAALDGASTQEHLAAAVADKRAPEPTMADYMNARFYHRITRGKRYDGPGVTDGIGDCETLDEVNELLRLVVSKVAADRKTVQRWLAAVALRKLALAQDRRQVFDAVIASQKPLILRDGREVRLRTSDAVRVTRAKDRRLEELEAATAAQRPALMDVSGRPLQASA